LQHTTCVFGEVTYFPPRIMELCVEECTWERVVL
jgi:hypothetical protein